MGTDQPSYIHGVSPDEQGRLSLLNELINEKSLSELGLQLGERVLDVGSGLGQLALAMKARVGECGYVLGIERSVEQLAQAKRLLTRENDSHRVEFREGNAYDFPLTGDEWGTFDLSHTRFLLEHVGHPELVVEQMARAVRVGGRVVLEDDDHEILKLWPIPEGFERLWQAYMEVYRGLGNDPIVGRRLVELLAHAKLKPRRNTWIFFGSCSGERSFIPLVDNMSHLLAGAREQIIAQGTLDRKTIDMTLLAVDRWKHTPNAAMWFAISWAEGIKIGA